MSHLLCEKVQKEGVFLKKINILVAIFRNVGYTMFQWEGEDALKA